MATLAVVSPRGFALVVIDKLYGEPYRWGGSAPGEGFDCSGLVIEVLRSVGRLPPTGDWTAAQLLDRFAPVRQWPLPGQLVFWRTLGSVTHVEMLYEHLDDGTLVTIGAGGGGRAITSWDAAMAADAFVRFRPLRAGWLPADVRDPFL